MNSQKNEPHPGKHEVTTHDSTQVESCEQEKSVQNTSAHAKAKDASVHKEDSCETPILNSDEYAQTKHVSRKHGQSTQDLSFDQLHRDDVIVRVATATVIIAVVIAVIISPNTAYDVIQNIRTFITQYFSWWIVVAAGLALIICLWVAFSKYGRIRLGGKDAKPQYSRFAWISMLFACGQGIGLIFWSVAEPILVRQDNPLLETYPVDAIDGALSWSYFHWAITAWAIYCIVAICMAYARFNRNKSGSFRETCEDILPKKIRRGGGLFIEWLAIITTMLGIATSFGFASMQLSSGIGTLFEVDATLMLKVGVIIAIALIASISVFVGVTKGMKRISEANSILSIALIVLVFVFGPTLFLLYQIPESIGTYIQTFVPMSSFMDTAAISIESWSESWNGVWTVFIFCWCFAFSPFVASFIASISKGRTLREFVFGIIGIPSAIVVIWIGVLGGTALHYDDMLGGFITQAVMADTSSGLFVTGQNIPVIGIFIVAISTILVGTYFITSIDSGIHALSGFVSRAAKPSAIFKVILVLLISSITLVLLLLGGGNALDTIQTGTIIGAIPFSLIVVLMVINLIKNLRADGKIIFTSSGKGRHRSPEESPTDKLHEPRVEQLSGTQVTEIPVPSTQASKVQLSETYTVSGDADFGEPISSTTKNPGGIREGDLI